jgi:putative transposase
MPMLSPPNQKWSNRFRVGCLANGRAIRSLTVLDDFTKEAPTIDVDTLLSGLWVAHMVVPARVKPSLA